MVMVAFCDAPDCKKRINPKEHEKIDVLKERKDVHRGECYNIVYAHKQAIETVAHSQVANLEATIAQMNSVFWKGRNAIGIPEEAPR